VKDCRKGIYSLFLCPILEKVSDTGIVSFLPSPSLSFSSLFPSPRKKSEKKEAKKR
jgi:hypothetical protein